MFKLMAKVDFAAIPYKGAAPALADVAGGHVPFMFVLDGAVCISAEMRGEFVDGLRREKPYSLRSICRRNATHILRPKRWPDSTIRR